MMRPQRQEAYWSFDRKVNSFDQPVPFPDRRKSRCYSMELKDGLREDMITGSKAVHEEDIFQPDLTAIGQ
ncbi:predicted protein [Plenodomus lingam JN3]|uniref:Predicted protein n=1 Tax=Leptosphaeria maculans (strain JN3 / isolate v23.1.3 / race Av1-4-5-6-7-8) TaxID=985895 RepID=E5A4J6_LEPMJ|nr:predicted protein [Plenodomus lingam JN3]CBX98544.1 predicted protein [Plenodomus lingam JN3]